MSTTGNAGKVKKPTHVPDSLVFEFDYNSDPEYCRDPHARAADLVGKAPPMYWTPFNGGHWMFQSYDAVLAALRDFKTFSSEHFEPAAFEAMMAGLPEEERIPAPVPICIDPPQHTKLRQPLFSTFSPRATAARETTIRVLAERLVDRIAPKGRCEFQHEVSDLYPVEIFLAMFGLPVEREREYRELAKKHLTTISPDLAANFQMMKGIAEVMRDTIVARRDDPKDDLISLLWSLHIEGEPMRLDLMLSYCVILFIAGLDTVVNALGFGVRHLASDLRLQRELRANPELIPQATEELLRRYSFVAPIRILKEDAEFRGVQLKAGERVMLFIPGASLDAGAYDDPTALDLRREKLLHMAFGYGPHFCLGAHLARLELKVMYETLLRKLPEFRLDPARPPTFHGSIIAGPSTIHLIWGMDSGDSEDAGLDAEPSSEIRSIRPSAPTTSFAATENGPVASSSIEGRWSVTIFGPTGPQETTLELQIVGGALGGSQSAMGQVEPLREVDYDSRSGEISWINKIRKPLPMSLKFAGVVEGGTMNGKVKAGIIGAFPFTASKR